MQRVDSAAACSLRRYPTQPEMPTYRIGGFMVARIVASLAMVTALAGTAQAQTSRLQGQISYPDRVQLGKTAVLEVTLEDVSDPAGPAVVIATTRMPKPGQSPVIFSVEYDTARIKPTFVFPGIGTDHSHRQSRPALL